MVVPSLTAPWRNWYLGTLGVVRYVARDSVDEDYAPAPDNSAVPADNPVQAARQQPVAASTESLAATTAAAPDADAPPRDERSPDGDGGAIAGPAQGPGTVAASTVAKQPASVNASDEEMIQCRLAFWQPSERLVVVSHMPPGIRPSPAHHEMLANLLSAIGQLTPPLAQAEVLDWPLAPGTDSTLKGARELLAAFLGVKNQLQPFGTALLMGPVAARLATERDVCEIGDKPMLPCQVQGIVTHSLYDMERDKALKRPTWEAIRGLAGGGH